MTETGDRLLNPEQKQVNAENFLVIQGWMRSELNLKGASLIVYAIIYGFSQDKDSYFQGTAKYLAEWAAVSVYTVYDVLKKLCNEGLIEKVEKELNGVKVCDYRVTQDHHRWQKTTTPVIKDHHPVVIKDHLDNINIDNIQDNIYKKTIQKKQSINLDFVAESFRQTFQDWLDYKKERKEDYKSLMSIKKCYSYLMNISRNDLNTATKIIERSIANNWRGLFELEQKTHKQETRKGMDFSKGDGSRFANIKYQVIGEDK